MVCGMLVPVLLRQARKFLQHILMLLEEEHTDGQASIACGSRVGIVGP